MKRVIMIALFFWSALVFAKTDTPLEGHEESIFHLPIKLINEKSTMFKAIIEGANTDYICWALPKWCKVPDLKREISGNKFTENELSELTRLYVDWKKPCREKTSWLLIREEILCLMLVKNLYASNYYDQILVSLHNDDELANIDFIIFLKTDSDKMKFYYLKKNSDALIESKRYINQSSNSFFNLFMENLNKNLFVRINGLIRGDVIKEFNIISRLKGDTESTLHSSEKDANSILISFDNYEHLSTLFNDGIEFEANDGSRFLFPHPTYKDLLNRSSKVLNGSRIEYVLTYLETDDFEVGTSDLDSQKNQPLKSQIGEYVNFLRKFSDSSMLKNGQKPQKLFVELIGYGDRKRNKGASEQEWLEKNSRLSQSRAKAVLEEMKSLPNRIPFETKTDPKGCHEDHYKKDQRNVEIIAWLE